MADIRSILNQENVDPVELHCQMERDKKGFIEQVKKLLEQLGRPLRKIPVVGYQEIDLYHLYCAVQDYGGFQETNNQVGSWISIWRSLENFDSAITDASSRLKKIYKKYLLDFEYQQHPERRNMTSPNTILGGCCSKKRVVSKTSNLHQSFHHQKFPLYLSGDLVIHNLGKMTKFGDAEWPVHFKSSRMFSSYVHPNKNVEYTSEICVGNDNQLQFVVTASDDKMNPVYANTPTEAWKMILARLSKSNVTSKLSVSVGGPLRFGLLHPTVKQYLRQQSSSESYFAAMYDSLTKKNKKRKRQSRPYSQEIIFRKFFLITQDSIASC